MTRHFMASHLYCVAAATYGTAAGTQSLFGVRCRIREPIRDIPVAVRHFANMDLKLYLHHSQFVRQNST